MIPLERCRDRWLYRLTSRNLRLGVFCRERRSFVGLREKFGARFAAEEFHWETGPPFGSARPLEECPERLPDGIELLEVLPGAICADCGALVRYNGKDAWFHAVPSDCAAIRPMGRHNAPLEVWLIGMEEKYATPV